MPKAARKAVDADFRAGVLKGVCSVMTIDRGYDHPEVGLAVIAFASISRTRVEQIAGRVMRVASGKTSARLLDYGEHGKRFGSFNYDYDEAIAFDRKRKRERDIAKKIERQTKGGPRTHLINAYASEWSDFTEAELPIYGLIVEQREARDHRRYVLVHMLTPIEWLGPHWLGSADYNKSVWKTKAFLDAFGALRPPGYAAAMKRFDELPDDNTKIAFVEATTRATVPRAVKNAPPPITEKLRGLLDWGPLAQSRSFDYSPDNLVAVIRAAPRPSHVVARRIRHYRDRHLIIAACAFRCDGHLHEFDQTPAVTRADLIKVARASEPAVSALSAEERTVLIKTFGVQGAEAVAGLINMFGLEAAGEMIKTYGVERAWDVAREMREAAE